MLARAAFAIAFLVAAVAAWVLLLDPRAPRAVRAEAAPRAQAAGVERVRAVDDPSGAAARAVPSDAAADLDATQRTAVAQEVLVRAHLTAPDAPRTWGPDWRFELQTWDEALDTVELHSQTADDAGSTEFRFPGFVHVDWVRVLPPESSGLAMAFVEDHVDLEPGEVHEMRLTPVVGGRIAGRVVDVAGLPAAEVRVHAFAHGAGEEVTFWQPGLVAVDTDAYGRFCLPRLPPGTWGVAAEPRGWLPYSPMAGEPESGRNEFVLAAGQEIDDVLLTVVRAQGFGLRVVAADGAPIPNASVQLEPLRILGGRMLLEAPPEPDPVELFLGRASPSSAPDAWLWPYDALVWTTNAQGEVRTIGPAGTWNLSVWAPCDPMERVEPALRQRIELPGPDLTLTLHATFESHRGRIEDESGAALEGVWVTLHLRDGSEFVYATSSDAHGRYAFHWLRPGTLYEVRARRNGYLTRVFEIAPTPADAPAQVATLRASPPVRLTLVDPAGEPLPGVTLILSAVRPAALRPGEQAAVQELEQRRWLRTGSRGTLQMAGVPAGEIDLALQRDFAVLDGDGQPLIEASGRARVEQRLVQTWTLSVPPHEHRWTIDLSAWPEPQSPALATHAGRVVDASTGTPIAGALVMLRSPGALNVAYSDEAGRYWLRGVRGGCALVARADGFAARRLPQRVWEPVEHEHDFALTPGDDTCEIVIEDRNGMRLPTVVVRVRDAEGQPVRLAVRRPGGEVGFASEVEATHGSVSLLAPPPGVLELEVSVHDAGPLGRCRVTVADTAASQTVVARLERSLGELRAELLARDDEDSR